MKNATPVQTHVIDATGRPVGRLATQVVGLLRGKQKPSFEPHVENKDIVEIQNVSKMVFTGKKMQQKVYLRHSGYLGSLKGKTAGDIMAKDPAWVLRYAVDHMLPKNRLRAKMMTRLIIQK